MRSPWAFWRNRLWPYWRDYPYTMKDVWWDLALGAFYLWFAYDNLAWSHRRHRVNYIHGRFEFWTGVFIAAAATVSIIRGVLVWRKLKRQGDNRPSAN